MKREEEKKDLVVYTYIYPSGIDTHTSVTTAFEPFGEDKEFYYTIEGEPFAKTFCENFKGAHVKNIVFRGLHRRYQEEIKKNKSQESQISELEQELRDAYEEIVDNQLDSIGAISLCLFCGDHQIDGHLKHKENCIILKAQNYLDEKEETTNNVQ